MTSLRVHPEIDMPVERSSVIATIVAALALLTYALVVPLVVGLSVLDARSTPTAASGVLLLITIYSGARIAREIARGASRWFVLVFHSFVYVFLGVVPLVQTSAGSFLWAVNPTTDVLLEAAAICLAGVLMFDVGLWFGGSIKSSRRWIQGASGRNDRSAHGLSERQRDSVIHVPQGGANRILIFLLALTVISLAFFYLRGGLAAAFASRSEMEDVLCPVTRAGDLAECGIVTAIVRVPAVILTIVALALRGRVARTFLWLALIVGFVALAATANPVSTPRFWFGAAALGVIGALTVGWVRARVLIWAVLPALLLLVFPTLDFGRSQGWVPSFTVQTEAIVQKQDFDAFQQVANGVTYVEAFGTRGGTQMASAALFFVPRAILPAKGPPTGLLVTTSLGVTSNNNVSAPLWEEAYIDFGPVGVALIFLGLGGLVAYLERVTKASGDHWASLAIGVAPFFASYGVFLLRGSLLPAAGPLAVAVLLYWAARQLNTSRATRPLMRSPVPQ